MPVEVRVGPQVLTINHGSTLMITDLSGEIAARSEQGVFFRDTRFVSSYRIFANGRPWLLLQLRHPDSLSRTHPTVATRTAGRRLSTPTVGRASRSSSIRAPPGIPAASTLRRGPRGASSSCSKPSSASRPTRLASGSTSSPSFRDGSPISHCTVSSREGRSALPARRRAEDTLGRVRARRLRRGRGAPVLPPDSPVIAMTRP